jgi:Uma2 family endonuclease
MATVQLKIGPTDHGRPLSLDDFDDADFDPGFKYEIVDGRVYVAPIASLGENRLENWLRRKLERYAEGHPEMISYVTDKPRVFVRARKAATVPEPDVACYADFPLDRPIGEVRWEEVSPVLVVEILVEDDAKKDLQRNPGLYFGVPSIKEYWVLDGRANPDEPTLIQHRRYGKRLVVRSFPYGSTFTTKLLPGFSLLIDPRR